MNIRQKILTGGVVFALILASALSYNAYQRFTAIILRNHEDDALQTAQTALTFLDANNLSVYEQDNSARQKLLSEWQRIADTQDAVFIYVIEPFNAYRNIRFSVSIVNTNSEYDARPIGYVMPTSKDEYKKAYRSLYAGSTDYAIIISDNGISLTGDHITAMVPIKDSDDLVEGILCVQWQMKELYTEKIFFLKRTVVSMLIYLTLMLLIGRYCLKTQLLNPLDKLT